MRNTILTLACLVAAAVPAAGFAQGTASGLAPADREKLVEALRADPPRPMKVRLQAALILGRSGGTEAVVPLAECLAEDADFSVRATCAMALGHTGDLRAIEPLVASLDDSQELVRAEGRKALMRYVKPEAVPYLQVARERGSPRVRQVLVEVAAQIQDPQAGLLLAELLGDPDEKVREQAGEVFKSMNQETVSALLLKALDHSNYRVKAQAAKVIGDRKQVTGISRLVDLASSPLEAMEVQMASRAALRSMAAVLDVRRLSAQARDTALERNDRSRSLLLLSIIGGPDALQAGLDVLREDDASIRGVAAQALADMGDPRALPSLREALARASGNDRLAKIIAVSIRKLERAGATP